MSEVVKKGWEVSRPFFWVMAFCSEAVVQGALIVARERKCSEQGSKGNDTQH